MAAAKSTRARSGRSRNPSRRKPAPKLPNLLGRFCDALALVAVACRSLEARALPATGQEALVLHAGLAALDAIYNDLDRAMIGGGRAVPADAWAAYKRTSRP